MKKTFMKKYNVLFALAVAAFMLVACGNKDEKPQNEQPAQEEVADNIYQFKVANGHGDSVSLKIYEGQVLMVVNTATQCGYTPQYEDLEHIYQAYKDQGFTILDFPCNQFGSQAPGSYDDIHDFCTGEYNITFPQFDKIEVNGNNASPLYVWLKSKKPGEIPWNFTKFIIDREGNVIRRYEANTSMSVVENAVVAAL